MKDFFDDATVLTPDQMEMRESLQKLCANYNDDYWLERDQTGQFPEDLFPNWPNMGGWESIRRLNTVAPGLALPKVRYSH